jgi:hypothetical protein
MYHGKTVSVLRRETIKQTVEFRPLSENECGLTEQQLTDLEKNVSIMVGKILERKYPPNL